MLNSAHFCQLHSQFCHNCILFDVKTKHEIKLELQINAYSLPIGGAVLGFKYRLGRIVSKLNTTKASIMMIIMSK